MNPLRKASVVVTGVAFIVLAIAVVSPRAIHAAVAALVQVANTPTTAVPTVGAPAASQLRYYGCIGFYSGDPVVTCNFAAVPAGQTLFVETASILFRADQGVHPAWAAIVMQPSASFPSGSTFIPMVQQAIDYNNQNNFVGALAGRMSIIGGGQSPPYCSVEISTVRAFNGEMNCSISGYLAPAQ